MIILILFIMMRIPIAALSTSSFISMVIIYHHYQLLGDKEETAINIAVACNLLLPHDYMDQVIINKNTAGDLETAKYIFIEELQV